MPSSQRRTRNHHQLEKSHVIHPPLRIQGSSGARINPALFIDRELSWIDFNQRVLDEARDARNPLLERINFLSIVSANLDEFFMIRVAGIKKQIQAGVTQPAPSGLTPTEQLHAIRAALLPQLQERQRLFHEELLPALSDAGIFFRRYDDLAPLQRDALHEYFARNVFPVLTPLAIDANHPFPFISNLNVNLLVVLNGDENEPLYARVKVPEVLPRLVELGAALDGDHRSSATELILLEDLIVSNLDMLFPGKSIKAARPFRITRDTDLEIEEDEASDLLETVEESIRNRPFGPVVRLSIDYQTSPEVRDFLIEHFEITSDDVYTEDGPLRLSSLSELYALNRPDLKYPSFTPAIPSALEGAEDVFDVVRRQPILLHHPFDSFTPVIDLILAAAYDPAVLAIKQTLYRVGHNSPIVRALLEARSEGKQVTVLVELKARFDEESNIGWARELEQEGVHVVYGVKGLKVHTKLLSIIRRDNDGLRSYMHLGTGNYNAGTAHGYTDFGLMTSDEALGADVQELFNVLTGYSDQQMYRKLLVAPHSIRTEILDKIARETQHHATNGDGRIIIKCNALTDEETILALYEASQAGVAIDLIVRGICCLRPGVPGISETIRVRSIVGRFLEHNRAFYFHNGGAPEMYLGSADLMERNLDHRVEALYPVEDPTLQHYLRDVVLDLYLRDNMHARVLRADGTYQRLTPGDDASVDAQRALLDLRTP
jgi:polyphosphate kinase